MRKLLFIILTLSALFACEPKDQIHILYSPARIAFDYLGGDGKIAVVSDIEWSATTTADWITINSTTSSIVDFSVQVNRGDKTRASVITIAGGKESYQVLVEQAPPSNQPERSFDSLALVDLANSCDGRNWYLGHDTIPHPWEFGRTIDQWQGVTTSYVDGQLRVVALNLAGVGIKGDLPASFSNLSELQILILRQNEISGNAISTIAKFPKLLYLDLARNQFINYAETPPEGAFNSLQFLDLSTCPILNEIPQWMLQPTIVELSLAGCQIIGNIPLSIGQLSNLSTLDLSNNQLSGSITEAITSLDRLTYLDLSLNQLSGEIPEAIGNLEKLQTLKLACNKFTGNTPTTIANMQYLNILNLTNNQLISFPETIIRNCVKLKYADISFNNIEGNLSAHWAELPDLEYLIVLRNRLSGMIPDELLNDSRWSIQGWVPQSMICPQQKGYGFTNDPFIK